MSDIWNSRKRSEVMSHIRSSGNRATELKLLGIFRDHQITGWRRRQNLTGKPDFVFRKEWLCVFVDGCFWHGCPKHATWPKQNATFWREKITKNRSRDRAVTRNLRLQGWKVVRVWEHQLRFPAKVARRIQVALAAPVPMSSSNETD
jgi:DNA mismatch endonuclease (patch repair protein)